jgi:CBS domain-containing protein
MGLLPLLGGCTASFFFSALLMRHSIMTEKIARRGQRVLGEYSVDFLDTLLVRDCCARPPVSLLADRPLSEVREWIAARAEGSSHQGFPVVDKMGLLIGVVTRRDILGDEHAGMRRIGDLVKRPPAVIFADSSLREAADHMVREGVGRLPVVERLAPRVAVGMISRSDLLSAHQRRLAESEYQIGSAQTAIKAHSKALFG